ncbi:hypothetical protein GCM10023220_49350 [Streptomyces ziwulingensis]|uniref:Uncharacterized protein n=1 Tax=Streptomyces ziwulingensis TaxID=1045501 RepID=A0ABP9CMP4_9ACTN
MRQVAAGEHQGSGAVPEEEAQPLVRVAGVQRDQYAAGPHDREQAGHHVHTTLDTQTDRRLRADAAPHEARGEPVHPVREFAEGETHRPVPHRGQVRSARGLCVEQVTQYEFPRTSSAHATPSGPAAKGPPSRGPAPFAHGDRNGVEDVRPASCAPCTRCHRPVTRLARLTAPDRSDNASARQVRRRPETDPRPIRARSATRRNATPFGAFYAESRYRAERWD